MVRIYQGKQIGRQMKDYYQILGVPENAGQEDIESAFRRLAFKYHPDTSHGNKITSRGEI